MNPAYRASITAVWMDLAMDSGYHAQSRRIYGALTANILYLPERAILHKINEDVPAEAAVLTCAVLGDSVNWLQMIGGLTLDDTVVIMGPGQQGSWRNCRRQRRRCQEGHRHR